MTKNDIVLTIAETTGMSQTDVKRIVQRTLDSIIDVLKENGRLELRNFGVFEVRNRKARKARNPRTGEEVMVPPCKVVSFKAGKRMESVISDGHCDATSAPKAFLTEGQAQAGAE
ncbi:MAG: integration host factor subunit beta [Planctomycetes bacterium]|nr:integration host factor subunit beta [Planctomycetota bacterium]